MLVPDALTVLDGTAATDWDAERIRVATVPADVLQSALRFPVAEITYELEYATEVVFPPAAVFPETVTETKDVCTLAEIVIVLAAFPIPIPAPADIEREPLNPFKLVTTLVAAAAGTDSVIVPPEALVLPVKDKIPTALRINEFPVNAVEDAVLPLRLIPVKLLVPVYDIVTVRSPAAVAVAAEIPPAPASAKLTAVPDTLVPLAERVCVPYAGAGTDKVAVPPEAFVLPDIDKMPAALISKELPVNAVVLAVFPEKEMPVKFDVPV